MTPITKMVSPRFLQVSAALLATVAARATPLEKRGTVGSDDIVGFAQTVPSGTTGTVYLAYKPHLYVVNGCVPFPAVDAAGDTKYVPCISNSVGEEPVFNAFIVRVWTSPVPPTAIAAAALARSTSEAVNTMVTMP